MKIELSIIIVSYNNLDVLIDCLNSILNNNDLNNQLEVIVVEQSPTDDIYIYIKNNYPLIKIIRAENRGFGAGNNRGAKEAKGKYLLFLNPDTLLLEPIGRFTKRVFESNPRIGLFGVQLLDKDRKRNYSFDCNIPFGFGSKVAFYIHHKLNWYR